MVANLFFTRVANFFKKSYLTLKLKIRASKIKLKSLFGNYYILARKLLLSKKLLPLSKKKKAKSCWLIFFFDQG